jgi:small-conductance mechanosensitive channel
MPRLKRWIGLFITFHLVVLAWIFFRAADLPQAMDIVQRLFTGPWQLKDLADLRHEMEVGQVDITVLLIPLFFLLDPLFDAVVKGQRRLGGLPGTLAFSALLVAIIVFGYFGSTSFIYFQF